jgi:hypothetical protein
MAKAQYRITTDSNWTASYGYAFLVIMNPSGSGKKLTLRSLEVFLNACVSSSALADGPCPATLYCCSGALSGEDMSVCSCKADSATSVPSGVVVRRNAMAASYSSVLKRLDLGRRGGAVGNQNRVLFGSCMTIGDPYYGGAMYRSALYASASVLEPITVNNGESLALVVDQTVRSITNPMRVNVVLSINGHTVSYDWVAQTYPGLAVFSVENTAGGGNVVKVLSYSTMDVGTTDTPTLRVVPVGQMYTPDINDTSKSRVNAMPMDSTYPALSGSVCKLYTDIGFIPQGVPEVAISPASAGTPQGLNYLHTRDFQGPMYRNMLVEVSHLKGVGTGMPDALGYSYGHKRSDLFGRRAGITINQGEGIAIVNSAETAVGVQPAWGGWCALSFAAQLDVEDSTVVTVTNLATGSRVKVTKVSDGTVLYNDLESGGSITFTTDYFGAIAVEARNATAPPYYQPWTSQGTTVAGQTITFTALQVRDDQ